AAHHAGWSRHQRLRSRRAGRGDPAASEAAGLPLLPARRSATVRPALPLGRGQSLSYPGEDDRGRGLRRRHLLLARPAEVKLLGRRPMAEPAKAYSDAEITAKVQETGLAGWYLEDGWLRRKYNTDGWPTTLMLVNAIGYLCEA